MSKQYGLVIPGKEKPKLPTGVVRKNVFGSDSDDDEVPTKPNLVACGTSTLKRKIRQAQQKALEEDPTVYQYDEIYDDMEAKKNDEKLSEKKDRKPRYIEKLLETASKRKLEQERRVERQVQREREAEGEEFADKETFVTSAYRKKLEEIKKLDEEQEREDYLEAIGDVRKQQDLGGFYRHLYSQKLGDDKQKIGGSEKFEKPEEPETSKKPANSENDDNREEETDKVINAKSKKRQYRKRSLTPDKDNTEVEEINYDNKHHLQSNLDADSDFSIDSSDSEDEKKNNKSNNKSEVEIKVEIKEEKQDEDTKISAPQWNDGFKLPEKVKTEEPKPVEIKKPKIDIWKKRTVDDVFVEAQLRYYNRKSMRQCVF